MLTQSITRGKLQFYGEKQSGIHPYAWSGILLSDIKNMKSEQGILQGKTFESLRIIKA